MRATRPAHGQSLLAAVLYSAISLMPKVYAADAASLESQRYLSQVQIPMGLSKSNTLQRWSPKKCGQAMCGATTASSCWACGVSQKARADSMSVYDHPWWHPLLLLLAAAMALSGKFTSLK